LPEDPEYLQNMVRQLQETVSALEGTVRYITARYEKLSHEMAVLKRTTYGKKSERLGGNLVGEQAKLFEESVAEDIAGVELELAQLDERRKALNNAPENTPATTLAPKQSPKRTPLPAHLPRVKIYHEPASTQCKCGCALRRMGEDITEKLDYAPGDFTVEQHIRGRWVCDECETFEQEPMPAYVIDKGSATPGLLAQVLVNKYADHLPHYRQEAIFGRAGLGISRSTLSMWTGQCSVALQPLRAITTQRLMCSPAGSKSR
jgi:transposase